MASLKEVKGRIASVKGTLKITSAMKMVASAKLHKAQEVIEGMLPYEQKLSGMLTRFLSSGVSVDSPYTVEREVSRVALLVCASNNSLCGGFNANVVRSMNHWIRKHQSERKEQIVIYPIGRKVAEVVRKAGFEVAQDFSHLSEKPSYKEAALLADELMEKFRTGELDRVDMIYHHFVSTGTQTLTHNTYLPLKLEHTTAEREEEGYMLDYLAEPSKEEIIRALLPAVLRTKIFTMVLDSNASEHAARTLAMQVATDNANDLIQDLTVMYNKSRQQVITNELLDIVGGSMA